eukprot:860379-Amphidinium_carterae.2
MLSSLSYLSRETASGSPTCSDCESTTSPLVEDLIKIHARSIRRGAFMQKGNVSNLVMSRTGIQN